MKRMLPILTGLLLAAQPLRAGRPSAAQLQRKHFDAAELAYSQGDFERALSEYKKALAAKRHPAILFNIAQCHRQLGHWKKALFFYRLFLSEMPDAPNKEEVKHWIREMEKKAAEAEAAARAKGRVSVVTTPAGAEVRVDRFGGKPAGVTPVILTLHEGPHLLVIQRPGSKLVQRTVTIKRGQLLALEVRLQPAAAKPGAPKPQPGEGQASPNRTDRPTAGPPVPRPSEASRSRGKPAEAEAPHRARAEPLSKKWWLWTGYGLAAALLVGATVTGVLTMRKNDEWEERHLASDRDTGRALAVTTDVLWASAALAAAATTAAAIVVWRRSKDRERPNPRALVTPACGSDGCGVFVQGRF